MKDSDVNFSFGTTTTDSSEYDSEHANKKTKKALRRRYERRQKFIPLLKPQFGLAVKTDSVSAWKRIYAEKLGIYYSENFANEPKDLSEILIAKIWDFTQTENNYIEFLNKHLKFSLILDGICFPYQGIDKNQKIIEDCFEEIRKLHDAENDFFVLKLWEFITSLKRILANIRLTSKDSSIAWEGWLLDIIKAFSELCHLQTQVCGQVHQAVWRNLYGTNITSIPDLRLYTSGSLSKRTFTENVISVTKVKRFSKPPSDSDSEESAGPGRKTQKGSCTPIELDLDSRVLGQHAGQLLLELHSKYKWHKEDNFDKDRKMNVLGMIVVGTWVYFTLLEIKWEHYQKLRRNGSLDDHKATIYYARPKNILENFHRHSLISDFLRLNNIDFF